MNNVYPCKPKFYNIKLGWKGHDALACCTHVFFQTVITYNTGLMESTGFNGLRKEIDRRTRRDAIIQQLSETTADVMCLQEVHIKPYEPRCEKTGFRGFRPGQTQTGLFSHRRWL